jgi:hypothetical protein
VCTGLDAATQELILYTDADLPCDFAELETACRLLRLHRADLVSAYRRRRTGEGPRRLVYSVAYNSLVRLVFALRIKDVNFAFKLMRRAVVERLDLVSEGSFIDAELLVRAQRSGFRIIQYGVDYYPRTRGTSTLSSWPTILHILRDLVHLYPVLADVRSPFACPGSEAVPSDVDNGPAHR